MVRRAYRLLSKAPHDCRHDVAKSGQSATAPIDAVTGVATITRLRVKGDRYVILSDNPSVPDDEEPQDFVTIVGRVVFVGAKM